MEFAMGENSVKAKILPLLSELENLKTREKRIYNELLNVVAAPSNASSECVSTDEDNEIAVQTASSWSGNDIAKEAREIAEQTVSASGFIFDKRTGCYFNQAEQCSYVPDYKLYYYHNAGAYYYFDEESRCLKYYSSVPSCCENRKELLNEHQPVELKHPKKFESEKEEGEISSDDEQQDSSIEITSEPVYFSCQPSNTTSCLRMVVQTTTSHKLKLGTIFVVTCEGATLGREGSHKIIIPDTSVSKTHLKFSFVLKENRFFFEVTDVGSRNGTFINEQRLSESLEESIPFEIAHGSVLRVGGTDLLCHVHGVGESCKNCQTSQDNKPLEDRCEEPQKPLQQCYNDEIKQIKKKYGLHSTQFPLSSYYSSNYTDRAELRRQTCGSSCPNEKTEMSSLDFPLNDRNKGFRLLQKMGWKEGERLGRDDPNGLLCPILPVHYGKRGLGAPLPLYDQELVDNPNSKKRPTLEKMLKRYAKCDE